MKKLITFRSLVLIFSSLMLIATASGQNETKKKNKKKNAGPKLSVVHLGETVPTAPAVTPKQPANGSLFTADTRHTSLFRDFKAAHVGDLVFVDVVEASTATVESSAARKRDSGNVGGIVPLTNAIPVNGAATVGGVISELGKRKFEGNGTTERTSNVRARITARVVEVFPNGDLRIEGIKLVKINRETEQVALSGIVRQSDLASDGSIRTTSIGDLRVDFNGKGIASADNGPGWLYRLFDKVSPF